MITFCCLNRVSACCSALWRVRASASPLRWRASWLIHSRMRGSASKGGGLVETVQETILSQALLRSLSTRSRASCEKLRIVALRIEALAAAACWLEVA